MNPQTNGVPGSMPMVPSSIGQQLGHNMTLDISQIQDQNYFPPGNSEQFFLSKLGSNSIFKNSTFTSNQNNATIGITQNTIIHTIKTERESDPEKAARVEGDIIFVGTKSTDDRTTLFNSRMYNLGAEQILKIDSNYYPTLTVHGLNAHLAAMPKINYLRSDGTWKSASEMWESWRMYGVINTVGIGAIGPQGMESSSKPYTASGAPQIIGACVGGLVDCHNYWGQSLKKDSKLYVILKKEDKKKRYKATGFINRYITPGNNTVDKPFCLSFYVDSKGIDMLPPTNMYSYIEEGTDEVKYGLVYSIGRLSYPFTTRGNSKTKYQPNDVTATYFTEKLRINVDIRREL